ncbi:restriction endonuclease subunit S [Streptococcus gallolyticus]|uniref:restriction endonuclease subunit S n=2 Tax=Streptococcus gallolyticus TaxID=315405 RepID=UPI00228412FD|nr:restriction endonuclease subunit S [Streptococcus gallolyticus]MCY7189672.1 restriction endonuclease subunit S [Streptococcus gallolyticus subsp. gallolyticus]
MIKKKKVPKLRFPGFTDDWEQRKLLDCAGFRRGSFPQPYGNKEWYDGEGAMPFVQVADITDDMKLVNDTKQKISKTAQPMSVFAEEGSVLVTLQGSIGRVAITQYGAFVDRTVLIFDKYNQDIDKTFWAYIIKEKFIDEARKAPGGTVKTITKEALSDFDLMIPSYGEQKNLGTFLVSIDRLITLHQRKLEHTKDLKKSMLQKMFPKKGEKNPEIRFPGFTDTWEQRKLSELVTMHARIGWQNLRTSEFLDQGDYMLITGTDFEEGSINFSTCHYVQKERYDQDKHIQISNGSILITKDGTLGKVAYVQGLKKPATLNAGVFNVEIKNEKRTDGKYLFQYLKAPFLMEYVGKNATGGTIKHLNQNMLVNFPVAIPEKSEQQKIGEYFSNLDRLITLHQRELEHLKLLKKGLLQQMFV